MGDRDLLRARCTAGDLADGLGRIPAGALRGPSQLRRPAPPAPEPRPRTLIDRVYQVVRREILEGRRPWMTAGEVCLLIGDRNDADVYQALKALRAHGCLRYLAGSNRLMEIAPGAPESAQDGRGMSVTSRANLKRNTRASMATARPVRGRQIVTG